MKKLQALHDVFWDHINTDRDNFDAWAEQGTITWSGAKAETINDAVLLFRQKYRAVFSFESYTGEAEELFLLCLKWINENDCDRQDDLGEVEFDAEKNSDESVDVEISLWLEDSIYGNLVNGDYVLLDALDISTAENVSINAGITCN